MEFRVGTRREARGFGWKNSPQTIRRAGHRPKAGSTDDPAAEPGASKGVSG